MQLLFLCMLHNARPRKKKKKKDAAVGLEVAKPSQLCYDCLHI